VAVFLLTVSGNSFGFISSAGVRAGEFVHCSGEGYGAYFHELAGRMHPGSFLIMKLILVLSFFCFGLARPCLMGQGSKGKAAKESEKAPKGEVPDEKRELHELLVRSIENASKAVPMQAADFSLLNYDADRGKKEGNGKPVPESYSLFYHLQAPLPIEEKGKAGLLGEIKSQSAGGMPVIPPDRYVALFDQTGAISSVLLIFEENRERGLIPVAIRKLHTAAQIDTGDKTRGRMHLYQVISAYEFLAVPVKADVVNGFLKALEKP